MDSGLPPQCAVKSPSGGVAICFRDFDLVGPASACDPDDAGTLPLSRCDALCPVEGTSAKAVSCSVSQDTTGGHLSCYYGPCATGRRPEGLPFDKLAGPDEVARFLAETAYLEAASVAAFERLARELEAHGAPGRLVIASRRAAQDEVRHARVTKKLAERAGARVPPCRVEPKPVRSLEEIALENATEGCVRETFGAAIAMMQGQRAGDALVRAAMKRIAQDETRHAELSWAVARWVDTRLDAGARARVLEERARAVETLVRDAAHEPHAELTARLGIPGAVRAQALLGELSASLWSDRAAAPSSGPST
jgi:hypothetical protein